MPITVPAFEPIVGTPSVLQMPVKGANSPQHGILLIQNLSPYELQVTSINNQPDAMVMPFMADDVSYDLGSIESVTILPIGVGFTPPAGITPTVLCFWYLQGETPPGTFPVPIVPYGNLQQVNIVGDVESVWGDPELVGATPYVHDFVWEGAQAPNYNLGEAEGNGIIVWDMELSTDAQLGDHTIIGIQPTNGAGTWCALTPMNSEASFHSARGLYLPPGTIVSVNTTSAWGDDVYGSLSGTQL